MGQPGVDTSEVVPPAALVLGGETSTASFEAVGAGTAGVSDIFKFRFASLIWLLAKRARNSQLQVDVLRNVVSVELLQARCVCCAF
jgi:hypothetical protein